MNRRPICRVHIPRACRAPLALLALVAAGCGRQAPSPEQAGSGVLDEHHDEAERVELTAHAIALAGIEVGAAQPRAIEVTVESPGEVRLNGERVMQVRPRFPGVVQQLSYRLGDAVRRGDRLAVVHSNESFTDYSINASMDGTVVSRDLGVGAAVDHENVLFTIADLSTVWVDFAIYPQHVGRIRRGQAVRVESAAEGPHRAHGTVDYVGPLLEQDTRVSYGRVVLDNRDGRWQPGLFVTVAVAVDQGNAPVAVPDNSIVRTVAGSAVFRAFGQSFQLQHVTRGRSDGEWTEVTQGLAAGDSIVIRNAFLLKAELGKSAAGHEH